MTQDVAVSSGLALPQVHIDIICTVADSVNGINIGNDILVLSYESDNNKLFS